MVNEPKINAEDYVNFLVASPRNFTCMEAARTQPEGTDAAHDAYTRLLQRIPENTDILWEEAKKLITFKGVLVIDDSTLDKPYANKMELVTYQWSGKHHAVVKGINIVSALWTNGRRIVPTDFRVYSKIDGKTKNDHFIDLLRTAKGRGLKPDYTIFDSWYSSLENLKLIREMGWEWVTRLKENRKVDPGDSGNVSISEVQIPEKGCIVHLRGYGFVKVFRFASSNGDTEYWATSNLKMKVGMCEDLKGKAWKIEEYHRGIKQCCGVENAQLQTANGQKSHILLSIVAFLKLEYERIKRGVSWYEIKSAIIRNAIRLFRADTSII